VKGFVCLMEIDTTVSLMGLTGTQSDGCEAQSGRPMSPMAQSDVKCSRGR